MVQNLFNQKRGIALLVALSLAILTACGGSETAESSEHEASLSVKSEASEDASGQDAEASEEAEAGSEEQPEESAEVEESAEEGAPEEQAAPDADASEFGGFVAIENDACAVTIDAIDPDSMWGYEIDLTLENRSADTTYMFSLDTAAVNGVESDPLFASEVPPGKMAKDEINLNDLSAYGITEYTDIELFFRIYDSEDWSADPVAEETVHIYPYGEEAATQFTREAQPTDIVLADTETVTALITDVEEDGIWGYTLNLFLINKTGEDVMFSVDDAAINGYMADPFFATSVKGGKCAFRSISWSDSTLEENAITEVQEIEFTCRAYYEDDWTGEDLFNESIVLAA